MKQTSSIDNWTTRSVKALRSGWSGIEYVGYACTFAQQRCIRTRTRIHKRPALKLVAGNALSGDSQEHLDAIAKQIFRSHQVSRQVVNLAINQAIGEFGGSVLPARVAAA